MAKSGEGQRRLSEGYSFAGFRARETVRGVFGDPDVRVVTLDRSSKKRLAAVAAVSRWAGTIGGYGEFATFRAPGYGLFWSWRCGASRAVLAPGSRSGTWRWKWRRKPRSCSTSSTSCVISGRRSTRCARRNTPASAARTGASSRARSTRCCRVARNLSLEGKRSLELLLAANKRLNTAYVLKESFSQLWTYTRESWARRFFDNWRASLKWQRLKPYERFAEMID